MVYWSPGQPSLCSRLQVLPEGSLRIQPVLVQDAGHYFCLASNSAGSDRQGRELQVFGRWTKEGLLLAFSIHPLSGPVLLSFLVIPAVRSQE